MTSFDFLAEYPKESSGAASVLPTMPIFNGVWVKSDDITVGSESSTSQELPTKLDCEQGSQDNLRWVKISALQGKSDVHLNVLLAGLELGESSGSGVKTVDRSDIFLQFFGFISWTSLLKLLSASLPDGNISDFVLSEAGLKA